MTDKEFQTHIYQLLYDIPAGKITSYGRLAAMAGFPRRSRLVGKILKDLPQGGKLPWFRVTTSTGRLAFPPDSASYKRQRRLLEAEGVVFEQDKVPIKRYLWHP